MLDTACRPSQDDLHALADAIGRHGFAHAAGALDLSPGVRHRMEAEASDAVQDVEDALQGLGRRVGTEQAEGIRLTLLRGMRGKIDELLAMAAA